MRWAAALLFVCSGCAESSAEFLHPDAVIPQVQSQNEMFPPVDTFWLQQEIARRQEQQQAEESRPVRHTVSLGYIGDTPLWGGMMNSTSYARPAYASYSRPGPYR
jgi:hypothetical protein